MIISTYYPHIASAVVQSGLPLEEVARQCLAHGLTGVDVILCMMDEATKAGVSQLKRLGFTVCSLPAHTDFLHAPSLKEAETIVDIAHELGASVIMAIPGLFREGEKKEAARQKSLPAIRHMVDIAQEKGIRVGVEDYDDPQSAVAGTEGMQWYLTAEPKLHAIFDTGNFAFMGENTIAAYEALKSRITHQIHCNARSLTPPANTGPRKRPTGEADYPVAVGKGDTPDEEILRDLFRSGFDGIVTIENFGSPNALQDLLDSADYIRRLYEEHHTA